MAVPQQCDDAGWDYEDLVRGYRLTILRLRHPHSGPACQDVRQHTFAAGGEMQDDDKCQAAIGRHPFEETMKRLDAPCRGTDANEGERGIRHRHSRGDLALGAAVRRHPESYSVRYISIVRITALQYHHPAGAESRNVTACNACLSHTRHDEVAEGAAPPGGQGDHGRSSRAGTVTGRSIAGVSARRESAPDCGCRLWLPR